MPELYHFSEDPTIRRFEPHVAPTSSSQEPVVWAIDGEHQHLYYFPRECPRVAFHAGPQTTPEDAQRFLGSTTARHVAAIEGGWLDRMRSARIYRYAFDAHGFELEDEGAGYWLSRRAVEPLRVEPVGDLLDAHVSADVELRILPNLWPLYEAVIASTLQFSIIRWRNAAPRPKVHT